MAGARREADKVSLFGEAGETSQEEKETPTESPTENNQPEESPSQKGEEVEVEPEEESDKSSEDTKTEETSDDNKDLPFHKHPRWKQMYEENKRLKETVDSLQSTTTKVKDEVENIKSNKQPSIPPAIKKLLGEDPEAYKAWQEATGSLKQEIIADWQKQQAEAQAKQQQQEKERVEAVASAVKEVEEKFNISLPRNSSEYNAFLKFMEKRLPMNADGSLNFIGGWEWYQELKSAKPDPKKAAKKQVASKTVSDRTAEKPASDVMTLDDFPGFRRR